MRRRTTTAKLRFAVCVLAVLCASLPAACNIFLNLERCDSDGDCADKICDPEAKICVPHTTEAGREGGDEIVPPKPDADAEAGPPPCDLNAAFTDLHLVPGLEALAVSSARFSSDEQFVYYSRLEGCALESCVDLYFAKRTPEGVFKEVGPINEVNANTTSEYWPTLTANGKLLYFESSRSIDKVDGSYVPDLARIWRAIKNDSTGEYPPGEVQIPILFRVSSGSETSPYVQPDGLSVYFSSTARGDGGTNFDIWVAELDPSFGIGNPKAIRYINNINTPSAELHPVATKDDLSLYFAREGSDGGTTIRDIYVSKRRDADASTPFELDTPVTELNTAYEDFPSWISDDQCRIYFTSDRPAADAGPGAHLWMASRPNRL
jgi:hypothetical protein